MKSPDDYDSEINGLILAVERTAVPASPPQGLLGYPQLVKSGHRLLDLRRYVRQFRKILLGDRPPGPAGDGPLWRPCSHRVIRMYQFTLSARPTRADHRVDIGWRYKEPGPFASYAEMSAWFAHNLAGSYRFERGRVQFIFTTHVHPPRSPAQ